MINNEARALFLDFGIDAIVGGVACVGIFDESYAESFGVISGSSPSLLVNAAVDADHDTAVTANGMNYVVRGIEPDGSGFKRLRLEAA